jgi:hypothetical protein
MSRRQPLTLLAAAVGGSAVATAHGSIVNVALPAIEITVVCAGGQLVGESQDPLPQQA